MPVRSSDDIIEKAREMEMARVASEENVDESVLREMSKRLDVLEAQVDHIMKELDMKPEELSETHKRLLGELDEWRSTRQLADELGYSQEHVSRRVAELRKAGHLETRRDGKTLLYRKV